MVYTSIVTHPAWLMIGVIEYDNRTPLTPNWDWIHQLPRKDCLHNFWQVYRHVREPFEFKWVCVSCKSSFELYERGLLSEN